MYPDNHDVWDAHERELERACELHYLGTCEVCGEPIYAWDDHYNINGDLVCDDCGLDWLREYRVRG